MTHKLLILMTALVLAGFTSKTHANNQKNATPSATESVIKADSTSSATAKPLAEGLTKNEDGFIVATHDMLAKIDVARYRQYGLIAIETIDPFVVTADEKITLKDPETANDGLNGIRFEEWSDKEWLNNNYIRSVRLYIDAYNLGLVKDEALDKHKAALKGKFCICSIEPFVYGGAWIHIAFVNDTSFSLRAWVYSFVDGNNPATISGYDVRSVELIDKPLGLTTEELQDALKQSPYNTLW